MRRGIPPAVGRSGARSSRPSLPEPAETAIWRSVGRVDEGRELDPRGERRPGSSRRRQARSRASKSPRSSRPGAGAREPGRTVPHMGSPANSRRAASTTIPARAWHGSDHPAPRAARPAPRSCVIPPLAVRVRRAGICDRGRAPAGSASRRVDGPRPRTSSSGRASRGRWRPRSAAATAGSGGPGQEDPPGTTRAAVGSGHPQDDP